MSDTSPLQLCTLGRAVGGLTRPSCGVQGTPRQARSGGAGQARLSGHRAPQQRTQAPPGTPGADGVPCALQTRCERCCGPVRPTQATWWPSPHGRGHPGTDQPPGACLGLQARRQGVIGSRLGSGHAHRKAASVLVGTASTRREQVACISRSAPDALASTTTAPAGAPAGAGSSSSSTAARRFCASASSGGLRARAAACAPPGCGVWQTRGVQLACVRDWRSSYGVRHSRRTAGPRKSGGSTA